MTFIYKAQTLNDGTRLRRDHVVDSNGSNIIKNFAKDVWLTGDDVWKQNINNYWIHVTHENNVPLAEPGWTAVVYDGKIICKNYQEINQEPPTTPTEPTNPSFPESFTLTDPSGAKAEYVFVRIIE